jgi:hypothetical protein
VPDVFADFSGTVQIADGPHAFVAAIEQVLAEGRREAEQRRTRARAAVRSREWSAVYDRVVEVLEHALVRNRQRAGA